MIIKWNRGGYLEEEVWKDIDGFPSLMVSDKGLVKNKNTNQICKPQINNKTGYYQIGINENGKQKNIYIHKLVALAFLGNRPSGYDVNHIDGNKLNNSAANLEYCSRSENIKHAYKSGLNTQVIPIKIAETGETFDTIEDCARSIDGDSELIRQCINPKYSRKTHKGFHFEPLKDPSTDRTAFNVRIVETGETFDSVRECERAIHGGHTQIMKAIKNGGVYKDLHFEIVDENKSESKRTKQPFLYPHQKKAVEKMFNGCICNGGAGSGKSRTGLYYYFAKNGGSIDPDYIPMKNKPQDLIIITTAKKKHDLEWEGELANFLLSTKQEHNTFYGNKVVVDSWNNIKKYIDITGAFFLFDEDKVCGKGAWARAFLKITKNNDWVILSASSGDKWEDYETVFIANGFYRNRTEFRDQHLNYSQYTKYLVTGYRNETRLIRLRDKILIDMDFDRHTIPHHEDIYVQYDIHKYKTAMRTRWDPYKNEPIQQASGLCYILRRIVNEDESRQVALLELYERHPRMIVFYSFDYERNILLNLAYGESVQVAEYSGHAHEPIPDGNKWVYLVQYTAGCEGFNCIKTDTIVFYSQNYSYKVMLQASGRIDRLNTPYTDLYYYHLKTRSGIDLAISKALSQKKQFNERKFVKW